MPLPKLVGMILDQSVGLSCDEQYEVAKRLAANVGYKLVPEQSMQGAEDRADILSRLDRLEGAVKDLNPGWNP